MSKPFITMGDRTSHGGTVISADFTFDIYGKFVARVGDLTVCPRCKGKFPITTGAEDMTSLGPAVARDGDKTACGATLIAGQATATWSNKSDSGQSAASDATEQVSASASSLVAVDAPSICLDCLAKAAAAGQAMVVRD